MRKLPSLLVSVSLLAAAMVAPACSPSSADSAAPAVAHYLANEGVMVVQGETKIVFDPLFNNTYRQYQALPEEMRQALFDGTPPYDGIDAILISHHHGDHFDPRDMVELLRQRKDLRLYAPSQAVFGMKVIAPAEDDYLFERVTSIELQYKEAPAIIEVGGLLIEAVNLPHAGWPYRNDNVQNLSYRVTLNETTTVVHMGDADINDVHFEENAGHWSARKTDMAFPPYWYLQTDEGQQILTDRVQAARAVGVHVPEAVPDNPADRPAEYQGMDLFTEPGETRTIREGAE